MSFQPQKRVPIPFIDSRIPAGFPSPANDYLEETIDLNEEFINHPLSTFIFTSEGDSMIKAFIPPKACLLIDRSIIPKTGDIVLAVVNGEFTVKYFEKSAFKCRLLPANEKYKPIEITEEMQMQVWGVVIKIFIDPKDIKHVRPC
jgi:DNA polymerase V